MSASTAPARETTVLHVGGLHYADEKNVVERVLGDRPGVVAVDANPVAQTATVTYDPSQTSLSDLRHWVQECGYHCAGQSVPGHICDPMAEHGAAPAAHDHAAIERAEHADGHGHGGHAGMSMDSMVRDMRNRFVVALVFTVPIVLWSNVGKNLLGGEVATPFGIDRDVWQFLLSLPIVLFGAYPPGACLVRSADAVWRGILRRDGDHPMQGLRRAASSRRRGTPDRRGTAPCRSGTRIRARTLARPGPRGDPRPRRSGDRRCGERSLRSAALRPPGTG